MKWLISLYLMWAFYQISVVDRAFSEKLKMNLSREEYLTNIFSLLTLFINQMYDLELREAFSTLKSSLSYEIHFK